MKKFSMSVLSALTCIVFVIAVTFHQGKVVAAVTGANGGALPAYSVLAPIESGNLLLFPVVRNGARANAATPFLTLDEGIKSGQVEVTEAGKARGLVRNRGNVGVVGNGRFRGDQVNTLVLINNASQPLLLLAGEIVTGGKQDRVIAKDRIVPAGSDPIDLSVFCIEPGRWTESSAKFGATAKGVASSFMVQPSVRQKAMVARDQQQVWSAVGGAISQMAAAPATSTAVEVSPGESIRASTKLATTSYAKAMLDASVSSKVDEAAASVMKSRDQVIATLRKENAVGVVVAVRGEIVWADIFSDPELLSRYWTKLVRSYAAESLADGEVHPAATVADAQRFLDAPANGAETSEGELGIYRYREVKAANTDMFTLESLLPGIRYDVHTSKLRLRNKAEQVPVGVVY